MERSLYMLVSRGIIYATIALGFVSLTTHALVREVNSINKSREPKVVKIFSPNCPHCNAIKRDFEKVSNDPQFDGIITFEALNIDKNKGIDNVESLPTIFFIRDGRVVDTIVGEGEGFKQELIKKTNNLKK
jgi:thioredoxin-like negative regulator of GroEL